MMCFYSTLCTVRTQFIFKCVLSVKIRYFLSVLGMLYCSLYRTSIKDILLQFPCPINTDSGEQELAESQFIIKDKFHNHTPQAVKSQGGETQSRNSLVTCRTKRFENTFFCRLVFLHSHYSNTVQALLVPQEKHSTSEQSVKLEMQNTHISWFKRLKYTGIICQANSNK